MLDPWALLLAVGLAMILREEEAEPYLLCGLGFLGLSIATSIDAVAAGLSLYLERVSILPSALLIGSVVASLTFAAALAGGRVGSSMGRWTRVVGGVIFIAVGLRILMIHLA